MSPTRSPGRPRPTARSRAPIQLLQVAAALAAALAVAIGALGAHAFRDAGDPRGAGLMETGGQYLLWHAIGCLALGQRSERLAWPILVLLASSLVFCATLGLLAAGAPGWFGAVTPLGGAGMILGWMLAAWTLWRDRPSG